MCVCVCIYKIAYGRAIRPCHPSHSMPLALILCVCVCVLIKLHITAQSGPVILVILCHSHVCVCVCVCVCIYKIAHDRAIRPCHPKSFYATRIGPLNEEAMICLLRKPLHVLMIRRDKGGILFSLQSSCKP